MTDSDGDDMARKELLALRKSLPNFGEFNDLATSFEHRSDREVAIIGAALIEAALEYSIREKFNNLSNEDTQGLLDSDGSMLSSLGNKVLFSHVTGIISDAMQSDLRKVASVRNTFAHHLMDLSFEQAAIAPVCAGFVVPQRIDDERHTLHESSTTSWLPNDDGPLYWKGEDVSADHLLLTDRDLNVVVCIPWTPGTIDSPRQRFIEAVQANWFFLMCRAMLALDREFTARKRAGAPKA